MTRVSLACVRPPTGGPGRVFPASRPSRGVVSCVALGLPGHPTKGVVPRYPPRGVLRDCSRPVPGSCRWVVSPLTGGFPHSPNKGQETHLLRGCQQDRTTLAVIGRAPRGLGSIPTSARLPSPRLIPMPSKAFCPAAGLLFFWLFRTTARAWAASLA